MFKSGTKIKRSNWVSNEYPQLVLDENTVRFTFMTDSFTWVVVEELPEKAFNAEAFDGKREEGFFAVKTTKGGFLISDIEYLHSLVTKDKVLGFLELSNMEEAFDYFAGCAVCGQPIEAEEKAGFVGSAGDLVVLPVCLRCCQSNPRIDAVIPKQLTYHDISVDWYEELEAFGKAGNRPTLKDDIIKEIETKCDACEKADCHPDCSPGVCPFYQIEDYLAVYHTAMFNEMKESVMQRLRRDYPDPDEQ
jgi:hypothetical protein